MNVLNFLRHAFRAAAPEGADPEAFAAAVRASGEPRFGDYQANGCMAVARQRGVPPREVAAEVAGRVVLEPLAGTPEVAGPGFLNVRLHRSWMEAALGERVRDPRLGLESLERTQTVVIDYSSPNVAKPMHVGHIRSTVIGDCLARVYSELGHRVIRDNHLGDWGSQFGMILWGWKHYRDESAYAADPVGELARLYRLVSGRIAEGEALEKSYGKLFELEAQGRSAEAEALWARRPPTETRSREEIRQQVEQARALAEAAREETAKLHAGDPEARRLWHEFMPHCRRALDAIYARLGVRFDVELGESFYDPMLADVVEDLMARGLAVPSEGAIVVFLEGAKAPMIVRKRDGAFNYATTDLATIRYRVETWNPDLILYVVDHRQSDHFKALFEVARRWGYTHPRYEHVAFGTILGSDRRPFKTRAGDTVGLESLLDEAVARARAVVDANSPELDEAERARVSEIVGLGAIKYADLCQNRLSDYVFDWDKMMALTGNTATYMQYAYARIRSIFRKGGVDPERLRVQSPAVVLGHETERALGLLLLRWPETIEQTASELKPNLLTDYLFDLANAYSAFYDACPVLKAEDEAIRASRLALCDLTARTLQRGLDLLGIEVAERM
jgi:arginyl-tRNA synthetase